MPYQNNQEDFERLCREVAGNVAKGLTTAGSAIGDAIGQAVEGYRANQAQAQQRALLAQQQALLESRFGNVAKAKRGGTVRTVFGSILSFSFGMPLLSCLVTAPWIGIPNAIVGTAVMAAFFIPSLALLISGTRRLKMARQLGTLQRIFGNREAVPIAEIAQATGQKPAKIISAIQELLRRGMLPQGHLDAEQRTLIVTALSSAPVSPTAKGTGRAGAPSRPGRCPTCSRSHRQPEPGGAQLHHHGHRIPQADPPA